MHYHIWLLLSFSCVCYKEYLKNIVQLQYPLGFPGGSSGEESVCQNKSGRRRRFDPWVGKSPWRKKWQPTPVFFPEKSHGQRSLAAYSPWGHKELDTTEWLSMHTYNDIMLYPVTLLTFLTSSSSFFGSLGFSTYMIISSVNKNNFPLSFLPYMLLLSILMLNCIG